MEKNREMPQLLPMETTSNLPNVSTNFPIDITDVNYRSKKYIFTCENANLPDGSADIDNQLSNLEIPDPNKTNPFEEEKAKTFSHILKTWAKNPCVKSVLVGSSISLTRFRDFSYISSIKIQGIQETQPFPLEQNTVIQATAGNFLLCEQTVKPEDKDIPYVFNLDFPNSHFYCYHELRLNILNSNYSLFKIEINGFTITKKQNPFYLTVIDHDPKYYNQEIGYEWKMMGGMVGCSHLTETILNKTLESTFKDYWEKGLVSEIEQNYPYPKTDPPKYIGLDIANNDMLDYPNYALEMLITYKSCTDKYYDFIIFNSSHKLNFSHIENMTTELTSSIYYPITRCSDAIGRVGLGKKQLERLNAYQDQDNDVKVSFCSFDISHNIQIPVGTLSLANPSINLKDFYYLLPKIDCEIFLIIEVPDNKLYRWLEIDMIFGKVFFDTEQRRHIAKNF